MLANPNEKKNCLSGQVESSTLKTNVDEINWSKDYYQFQ